MPFIAVVNSVAPADFKAMNAADETDREARGGKRTRKQMYSARSRRIITSRKKGAKGPKGRRKIERSRSFRNKR